MYTFLVHVRSFQEVHGGMSINLGYPGEEMYLIGSADELGAWDLSRKARKPQKREANFKTTAGGSNLVAHFFDSNLI